MSDTVLDVLNEFLRVNVMDTATARNYAMDFIKKPFNHRSAAYTLRHNQSERKTMSTHRYSFSHITIIFLLVLGLSSCSRVDEKISQVRRGASVVEVIQLLGKPDSAWGSVAGPEMVLIYKGQKTFSVLFSGAGGMTFVLKIVDGELGGPGAVPLREKIDVVISGDRIEFRKAGR